MRIEYLDLSISWHQPLMCVTHVDRPTELERCALNFLEQRYESPTRLPGSTPFDELRPLSEHQPYGGTITVWAFPTGSFEHPRLVAFLRPDEKPQHAIWYRSRLWVLRLDRVDVYDDTISRIATISDPWMSGTHTIVPDGLGRLLVSCSSSDSVLVVDEKTMGVTSALRLPTSIYGVNYPLARDWSVVDHFIPNDGQLTHINRASPWKHGIVVSTLIQGALGWFSPDGRYSELVRGYVGCHGVRADSRSGRLFFSDSCLGVIVFLDEQQKLSRRYATDSRWLHDAEQLYEDVFAVALSDVNRVDLIDVTKRLVLASIACDEFGLGPQFIAFGR